ncbi:MAG TPA: hypothetical protein PLK36_10175 [Methanoregulaceae archaeon]|nr:hypothetical protein [Methanoregulaceae archaeon]HQN90428.1 hypothetical protein [Methanoregulaceae archaeon]
MLRHEAAVAIPDDIQGLFRVPHLLCTLLTSMARWYSSRTYSGVNTSSLPRHGRTNCPAFLQCSSKRRDLLKLVVPLSVSIVISTPFLR